MIVLPTFLYINNDISYQFYKYMTFHAVFRVVKLVDKSFYYIYLFRNWKFNSSSIRGNVYYEYFKFVIHLLLRNGIEERFPLLVCRDGHMAIAQEN